MAYPVLLAVGAAASAAGAGLEYAGAQRSSSAMNQAVENEIAQQNQLSQQGRNLFASSLSASSPQSAQRNIAQGRQQALAQYQSTQATPLTSSKSPLLSGGVGSTATGAQIQQGNASQAQLRGYTEWDLQQAIKNLQTNGQLGVINRFAQGDASVLPYQLQQASQAGAGLTGIGSILGSVGGGLMSYGALSGLGAGAGAAAGASASDAAAISALQALQKAATVNYQNTDVPTYNPSYGGIV